MVTTCRLCERMDCMDDYRVSFEASGVELEGRFGSEYLFVEHVPKPPSVEAIERVLDAG